MIKRTYGNAAPPELRFGHSSRVQLVCTLCRDELDPGLDQRSNCARCGGNLCERCLGRQTCVQGAAHARIN